jgi:hypothetical protein
VNIYKIGRSRLKSSASLVRAETTRRNGKSAPGLGQMDEQDAVVAKKLTTFISSDFSGPRKKCATHQNVLKEQRVLAH